ncbi:YbaB/EbfC family nucleoid-associated protein [Micromonospora taraxaci]|uniref:YbaB/EbfC family nucleoid-associated protein n=1 Tax=Micromonospora taraxaci TaxID=1316803 RepID=UPI0033BBB17E
MTYPSDLSRSISELLSTLGGSDAGSAAEAVSVVQGTGEAADGMVRVVAIAGGQIESVWIDPRMMREPSETLAEHIREATNSALTDLRSALAAVAAAPDTTALLEQLREVQRSAVPQLQGIIDTLGDVQERLSSGRRP